MRAAGFANRAVADEAARWLRSRDATGVALRAKTREAIKRYRVYLPPLASRKEAAAKVREIRALGVRDVAVIGRGTLANGVSLGVYRQERNMRRRTVQLQAMGIPHRFMKETKTVETYAIEARAAGDRGALNEAWAARFPGRPLKAVDCTRAP